MVSTVAPSACHANMVQAFTALPSTWTTQAPHCEVSHPTWVPVRRKPSRRYCTSSVRASASALTALPFTVMETAGISLLLEKAGPKALILGRTHLLGLNCGRNRRLFAGNRCLEQEQL